MTIDSLINGGLLTINPEKRASRHIVVLGVARGGTSLVAGALAKLGLFMGDTAKEPVFEDTRLAQAFEAEQSAQIKHIVEDYNSRFPAWGFKRPSALRYLDRLNRELSNPRYVVIFKDPFSIANRNRISMQADITTNLRRSLEEYSQLSDFLHQQQPPSLLVSYDKALDSKQIFLQTLADFAGLNPDAEQCAAAEAFITPNPEQYLDSSRVTLSKGRLDSVNQEVISGWAYYVHRAQPATVQLYVDDKLIMSTCADILRPDLLQSSMHATGHCGFAFRDFDAQLLKDGAHVRVRVIDDIRDLNNSPLVFQSTAR